ncbi:MAG: hypothetical protein WBA36_01220 [Mesorhizobium sp.]
MSISELPFYANALDIPALWEEFPPPPLYFNGVARMDRSSLAALQARRFMQQMERAWQVPFYQRHWGRAGLKPGDIRGIEDISIIPPFSVADLRESIELMPPFGDYMGYDPKSDSPMPLVMQTSGGTTGIPRPMLYSPRDREVVNIMGARRLYAHGVRPHDLVQVTHSLGLSNAGLSTRESLWKYTGAVPVMTGAGSATPTRRQIELMKAWKVKVLIGFPAYLRHMALVARDEMGIDPRTMDVRFLSTHLGTEDRGVLEDLWGAKVYDTYGANEAGMIAADCEEQNGMHIYEDAHFVEVVDLESGKAVPEGENGTVFVTCLFKHLAPMIRFNINDISAVVPGDCPCGCTHRRLAGIFGRSDNMVKLRGVNVYPDAIGSVIGDVIETTGEYVCVVDMVDGRDEMTVLVESVQEEEPDDQPGQAALELRFKEALNVKVTAKVVVRGALDQMTGLSKTSKIKRLIDNRKKG